MEIHRYIDPKGKKSIKVTEGKYTRKFEDTNTYIKQIVKKAGFFTRIWYTLKSFFFDRRWKWHVVTTTERDVNGNKSSYTSICCVNHVFREVMYLRGQGYLSNECVENFDEENRLQCLGFAPRPNDDAEMDLAEKERGWGMLPQKNGILYRLVLRKKVFNDYFDYVEKIVDGSDYTLESLKADIETNCKLLQSKFFDRVYDGYDEFDSLVERAYLKADLERLRLIALTFIAAIKYDRANPTESSMVEKVLGSVPYKTNPFLVISELLLRYSDTFFDTTEDGHIIDVINRDFAYSPPNGYKNAQYLIHPRVAPNAQKDLALKLFPVLFSVSIKDRFNDDYYDYLFSDNQLVFDDHVKYLNRYQENFFRAEDYGENFDEALKDYETKLKHLMGDDITKNQIKKLQPKLLNMLCHLLLSSIKLSEYDENTGLKDVSRVLSHIDIENPQHRDILSKIPDRIQKAFPNVNHQPILDKVNNFLDKNNQPE